MKKAEIFNYTWYPYDWMSSEKVFDLTLSQRGLYRELIDLCMTEDNKVKINFNGWARKYNSSLEEIVSILPVLERLDLIIVEDDYLSIPSCEIRLNKISTARSNGSKGGAPLGNSNAKKQSETTQEQPKNNPKTNYNYNYKDNSNNNSKNTDIGGWEKVIGLFPPTKHNGLIEAAIIWNTLEQKDKQSVMRHLNPYIKNTEERFMKQIGNYFNERMWENMKSKPTSSKMKMLDYNFIEWIKEELEFERFDEARTYLASLQVNDRESFNDLENEYKQLKNN
jgi:hypothetical protein